MKTCRVHDEPLYALTLDGSEIENVCVVVAEVAICTPHHRETIYDRKLFVDLENCGYKILRLLTGYMVLYSIYRMCYSHF